MFKMPIQSIDFIANYSEQVIASDQGVQNSNVSLFVFKSGFIGYNSDRYGVRESKDLPTFAIKSF